jgi:hypothetical protein
MLNTENMQRQLLAFKLLSPEQHGETRPLESVAE